MTGAREKQNCIFCAFSVVCFVGSSSYHCYAFIDKIMGKLEMPLSCVYCHGQTVFCDFVPNSREILYAFLGHDGGGGGGGGGGGTQLPLELFQREIF